MHCQHKGTEKGRESQINIILVFLKHFRNLPFFSAWLLITSFTRKSCGTSLTVQKAEQGFESSSMTAAFLVIV